MADLSDFVMRLSGGASNTAQASALGGAMSTVSGGRVLSQADSGLVITGVAIDDAMDTGKVVDCEPYWKQVDEVLGRR